MVLNAGVSSTRKKIFLEVRASNKISLAFTSGCYPRAKIVLRIMNIPGLSPKKYNLFESAATRTQKATRSEIII